MAHYGPVVDAAQLGEILDLLHKQGYRLVELTEGGLKVASAGSSEPRKDPPAPRQFGGRDVSEISWALGRAPTAPR